MSQGPLATLPWTPFGALASSEGEGDHGLSSSLDVELFRHVTQAVASEFSLEAGQSALAWEVASWQPDLEPAERRAFFLLTLCLLVDLSRGSTRTPLPTPAAPGETLTLLLAPGSAPPAGLPTAAEVAGTLGKLLGGDLSAPSLARLGAVAASAESVEPTRPPKAPLLFGPGFLYQQLTLLAELRLARSIRAQAAQSPLPAIPATTQQAAVDAVLANPPSLGDQALRLAPEQLRAVQRGLAGALTLVSGGPGTGKTSIVVSLLRALVRAGVAPAEIALAAPTGKASQRMREAIELGLDQLVAPDPEDQRLRSDLPEAVTLHRLLGATRWGSFRHHEQDPLAQTVVIVDEASMIDLHLFDRLLRAVRAGARLVLLGDANQLPSVGAGTVLRDLLPPQDGAPHPLKYHAVRLRHNFRMREDDPEGSTILGLAEAIQAEEPIAPHLHGRAAPSELTFAGVESIDSEGAPEVLRDFLELWFQTRVRSMSDFAHEVSEPLVLLPTGDLDVGDLPRLDRLFAHYGSSRLLCPTRVHRQGVNAINAAFHQKLQILLAAPSSLRYVPGEPLLATANDYERGLFNGDQGVVMRVQAAADAPLTLQGVFATRQGYRVYPLAALAGQVELAFATTVHKSQGSEFDHVALVLPERDTILLTREIVYTAVTRAKRSVTLFGDPALLSKALTRRVSRETRLAEVLGVQED